MFLKVKRLVAFILSCVDRNTERKKDGNGYSSVYCCRVGILETQECFLRQISQTHINMFAPVHRLYFGLMTIESVEVFRHITFCI